MKHAAITLAFFTLLATDAAAQRIIDNSLSVEDTMREPNISASESSNNRPQPGGIGGIGGIGSGNAIQSNIRGLQPPLDPNGDTTVPSNNSFIDSYCDPNFQPVIKTTGALQTCLQQTREQACILYSQAPQDVQAALSTVISCNYAASENGNPVPNVTDCAAGDRRRLGLIKKYWQDQDTAYALVFLPDMVLNTTGYCSREGGY